MSSIKYRPDIDGLRAVAVISVVIYHYFPKILPGGFIGVDIFFVISGFLVTNILTKEYSDNTYSIIGFYKRRILRIFPALFLVLIATLAFGWYVLTSYEFQSLGKHIAGGTSFISNIILWLESGYFDTEASYKPLLHLWSLGIEEQYYLIYPLLLISFMKLGKPYQLIVVITVISLLLNIYYINFHQDAVFYSAITRAWELLTGSLAALGLSQLSANNPHVSRNLISVSGSIIIALSYVLIDEHYFPGWQAIYPCIGSAMIIISGKTATINRLILACKPLVFIGLISYPIYLWHWPLLSFAKIILNKNPSQTLKIILIILTLLLAFLTYYFIERKLRYTKLQNRTALLLTFLMSSLMIAGLLVQMGYIVARNSDANIAKLYSANQDWQFPDGLIKKTLNSTDIYILQGGKKITLMFGDSHMQHYSPRVTFLKQNSEINTVYWITGGCLPVPFIKRHKQSGNCQNIHEIFLELIKQPEVEKVVLSNFWIDYFSQTKLVDTNNLKGGDLYFTDPELGNTGLNDQADKERAMLAIHQYLSTLATDKKTYFILDNPSGEEFSPLSYLEGNRLETIKVNTSIPDRVAVHEDQKTLLLKFSELAIPSNWTLINPWDKLCHEASCSLLDEQSDFIFKDNNHLRSSWVRQHASYIDQTVLVNNTNQPKQAFTND